MGKKIVVCTLLLALVAAVAFVFVPAPQNWTEAAWAFHYQLTISAVIAVLHVGASVLFLNSLGAYKTELRKAYIYISVGVVVIALGTLQLPILSLFNLWESAWVTSGGIILPFLVAGISLYAGARLLGRLVNAKTVLTKASVVVPAIIAITVVLSFLPHGAKSMPELEFDISNAVLVIDALFMLSGALIVLRIKNQIGEHYVNAMAWLFAALFGAAIILLIVFLDALFTNGEQELTGQITNFLAAMIGLIWLRAAYAFAKAKDY